MTPPPPTIEEEPQSSPAEPSPEDARLVAAILAGDEAAFELLVRRYHEAMVRLAVTFVRSRAVAEEVAQETWVAVLRGLDRFEGRSSLRTWIFRILMNRARTRGERERRTVPFSSLTGEHEPAVPAERFLSSEHAVYPGHWATPPRPWDDVPEARLIARETEAKALAAIDELPAAQRAVILLRDVHGLDTPEVCELLGVSEGNQRVLLHRARAKVRAELERYFAEEAA